jgi:hypothetical protein
MSNMHEKTLKLVTNLDRNGIEARIAEVRKAAQSSNLTDLATALTGVEGMPRAQLQARVTGALKLLRDKPEHKGLSAQLELIELNLPNLK